MALVATLLASMLIGACVGVVAQYADAPSAVASASARSKRCRWRKKRRCHIGDALFIANASAATERLERFAPLRHTRFPAPPRLVSQWGGAGADDDLPDCDCGPGDRPKTTKGAHKRGCARDIAKKKRKSADADHTAFENFATPQKAPRSAKVYIEKTRTPGGKHTVVELNAYDSMYGDGKTRDPNAPRIGTLSRRKRPASPLMDCQERRSTHRTEESAKNARERRLKARAEGAQPLKEVRYVSRFNPRPGESQRLRYDRVMSEFGEVYNRTNALRERDAKLRDKAARGAWTAAPNRSWPPPCPPADSNTTNLNRLRGYFEHLDSLPSRIKVCSNCREKTCNNGVGDGATDTHEADMCWFCREKPDALHWSNGLDLDLRPDAVEGNDTDTCAGARMAFAKLLMDHGSLSPVEEAMISPVCACFSVLKLPSGGQLGYRGNVINFSFDVGKVSRDSCARSGRLCNQN